VRYGAGAASASARTLIAPDETLPAGSRLCFANIPSVRVGATPDGAGTRRRESHAGREAREAMTALSSGQDSPHDHPWGSAAAGGTGQALGYAALLQA
jgi:hypothetical protein